MTTPQELQAGPELDAAVCEKVLGWQWRLLEGGTAAHLVWPQFKGGIPAPEGTPRSPWLSSGGGLRPAVSTELNMAFEYVLPAVNAWVPADRAAFVAELERLVGTRLGLWTANTGDVLFNLTAEDICRAALGVLDMPHKETA